MCTSLLLNYAGLFFWAVFNNFLEPKRFSQTGLDSKFVFIKLFLAPSYLVLLYSAIYISLYIYVYVYVCQSHQ